MGDITVRVDETGRTFGLDEFVDVVRRLALAEIAAAPDPVRLDHVRQIYLGRRGVITQLLRAIGRMKD